MSVMIEIETELADQNRFLNIPTNSRDRYTYQIYEPEDERIRSLAEEDASRPGGFRANS